VTQADGMYFFGVWTGDRAGHYLYDQNGRPVWGDGILPWRAIDGVLQPNAHDPYVFVPMAQQVQGEAMLHHKGGSGAVSPLTSCGARKVLAQDVARSYGGIAGA